MDLCFHVFKAKTGSFDGVVVSLGQKCDVTSRFRGSLFQFVHDDVPRKHHHIVDRDPSGPVTDRWLLALAQGLRWLKLRALQN